MRGLVDLHNHLIPGVDDGAADLDDSIALARALHSLGFDHVVTTPHVQPPRWDQDEDDLARRLAPVVEALGDDGPSLEFAAENLLDDVTWRRFEQGKMICYPGGKAALVEFSATRSLPTGFDQKLFEMSVSGVTPVLAHPERYGEVCDDLAVAERLVNSGVILLVSLSSFSRNRFLDKHAKRAEALVTRGLATAAATDIHSIAEIPLIAKGMKRLGKLLGHDGLELLLSHTPRRLIA